VAFIDKTVIQKTKCAHALISSMAIQDQNKTVVHSRCLGGKNVSSPDVLYYV